MKSLFWQTTGSGNQDLVLLHGWGLNAEVWSCIISRLSPNFRVHMIDLPGYGRSSGYGALTLPQMAEEVSLRAPNSALWLGWSLGGLIATQAALQQPDTMRGLITVASSPRFCAEGHWPGIRLKLLDDLAKQLNEDFFSTVCRFFDVQTLGNEFARQDARWLKSVVLGQPMPSKTVLASGWEMIQNSDLRPTLYKLNVPMLRLYGYLDALVPRKVIPHVDALCPTSRSIIFHAAAHAPFISHPDRFCQVLNEFSQYLS
ncbi:MAG: pimeloyl-acyl carrier protein methyl ester esterase [Sodalis sp. Ffu]|nr:MAG: pimeloyl-acyl carrier protein methyl ester esterase [Sodalis sp. Ffu]